MVSFVSNPRVTLDIIPRDQRLGLEDRRALIVGQLAPAVAAKGHITFAANPTASHTITLNGTTVTFVASGASGAQVNIGADLAATLAALKTMLNASADAEIAKCTYDIAGSQLLIVYDTVGTGGNSFTLASSNANGVVSAATLTGGAAAPGSSSAGLHRDIPRTAAEINTMFGARSHLAMMAREYRRINPVTNLDVIALADNASGTRGTCSLEASGTCTRDTTVYLSVVSASNHRYEIDIDIDDTPAEIMAKIKALVDLDTSAPFTCALSNSPVTKIIFTAANGGNVSDNWLIMLVDLQDRPVNVPGITFTLTGWSGGGTDPVLTTVFDDVANIRYQTVVWPECYDLDTLKDWLEPRKNVDNNLMDGTGYVFVNDTFANVKTLANNTNSSEIVLMTNESNDLSYWKGPHVPEPGDVSAAKFAGAVDRRYEDGFSISDLVVTNEPKDQFGGMDKASLPLFNTPLLFARRPINGSGYSFEEQVELENYGVTVVGYNRPNNAVIMGQVVTTWLNDAAGNSDDTWKYLEWRHTHGAIREYFVLNLRKEFSQYRLSRGVAVPGYAIATEEVIRAFLYQLYDELADMALTVKGRDYRRLFEDRLVVTLKPELRRVEIAADVPMISQLGEILGSVKFNFDVGTPNAQAA